MSDKSNVVAELKIKLYAGNGLVAQSSDRRLWHKILAIIENPDELSEADLARPNQPSAPHKHGFESASTADASSNDAIKRFAHALGISEEEIQGACQPSFTPPYLHLSGRYYESFLKAVPTRGPGAVSRIGLAATLLCLWAEFGKLGKLPSISDSQAVLSTIHLTESNVTRSFNNSLWLQKTPQGIAINPAKRSRAIEIARIYCTEGKGS